MEEYEKKTCYNKICHFAFAVLYAPMSADYISGLPLQMSPPLPLK